MTPTHKWREKVDDPKINQTHQAIRGWLRGAPGMSHTIGVPDSPLPLGRKDVPCVLLILSSCAVGLWASWQRWGNPLIDAGREMNVPLRLAHGEALYTQVRYIYGPLSPYLNAELYRIFGARLSVICGGGIVATIAILALLYWLARRLMNPAEATIAVVAVTWLCAIKPEGNYILPYAYSVLHGSLLDLTALAFLVCYVEKRHGARLALAGVCAGLAALAKTEMGVIAIGTGVAAILLVDLGKPRQILQDGMRFLLPAIGLPALVYWRIAQRTSWATLTRGSFLFFGSVPWQLIHFNQVRFGFDHPWHSLLLMALSLARLLGLAGVLGAICLWARGKNHEATRRRAWALLLASLALVLATSFGLGDLGPLLPMPLVLAAMLLAGGRDYFRQVRDHGEADVHTVTLLLVAIFSLLSVLRIFLRVSTGGALSSVLIPSTMILFVYCWVRIFPGLFVVARERQLAWKLVMAVLSMAVLASAVTLSVKYRRKFTYTLAAPRGTMRTQPDLGATFQQAGEFLQQHSHPEDFVAVVPEGTSLDFLWERRNSLRDEILLPGMVDARGEQRAIRDLEVTNTQFFLVTNRSTREFGQTSFGRDYDSTLMDWVLRTFRVCATFGPDKNPDPQVGDPKFFIRVYCRGQ